MRIVAFFSLLFFALASATKSGFKHPKFSDANHNAVFRRWVKHFGRNYGSPREEASKFATFLNNYRFVSSVNAQNKSYKLGLNQFADMTPKEFKLYVHGTEGSCLRQSNRKKLKSVDSSSENIGAVPDEVDWTTKGVVTPVKNQQQCGSCWAFSTTGSIESRVAIATGKLVSLSEQELVDCSKAEGNHGCQGGLMDDAFKYVEANNGLCSEEEYPYKAKNDLLCKKELCKERYDAISGYVDVTHESESALQAAVAAGPVSIAIEADQRSFQLYRSGVLTAACGTKLDHGVLAVGYGTEGGKDFWKVKNSWGTTWGEEGYVKLCRNCHANGEQGECGILDQPSYPTPKA